VTVYPQNANGNVAPIRTIAGPATGLDTPVEVTFDSSGKIYVVNRDGNSVTVYAANANGNVAPLHTIAGMNTLLHLPAGMALR
jgi:outer membrane protein assembly factor BamB